MITLYYGQNNVLSNMYRCSFYNSKGRHFTSVEQYYQYQKAKFFRDYSVAKKILQTNNPYCIKNLGRKVYPFNRILWHRKCVQVMYRATYYKFSSNSKLARTLLSTRKLIAEASPHDVYFGIGLSIDDPDARNPKMWRGKNVMGQVLMDVRNRIMCEVAQ